MRNYLQNWLQIFHSFYSFLFSMWLCNSSHLYIPYSGFWFYDLYWPIECSRSYGAIPRQDFHSWSWNPIHDLVDKPSNSDRKWHNMWARVKSAQLCWTNETDERCVRNQERSEKLLTLPAADSKQIMELSRITTLLSQKKLWSNDKWLSFVTTDFRSVLLHSNRSKREFLNSR